MITYQEVVSPDLTGGVQRCLAELHYMFITEIIPVLRPHLVCKPTEICTDRPISNLLISHKHTHTHTHTNYLLSSSGLHST